MGVLMLFQKSIISTNNDNIFMFAKFGICTIISTQMRSILLRCILQVRVYWLASILSFKQHGCTDID